MKKSVLIVEDDRTTRESLKKALSDTYIIHGASNGLEALDIINKGEDIDMILTDMTMPGMDGMELLEKIRSVDNDAIVVMITGHSSIESAVEAMRRGAYDYITKPLDLNKLEIIIKNALEVKRLRANNILLRQKVKERYDSTTIVGSSPKIKGIMDIINRVSSTKVTVLIQGESGTGKELIANVLHYNSPVAEGPFIKVNCSALAESVLESELFGHEKGAFTGAIYTKKGWFELADEGTLFLDEIGDLPLTTQVKLLRFLQESTFERVGGTKTIKVDVRIISATNKNLEALIKDGKFRDDLFYRLRVITIDVPPLREREEDIPLIVDYHLKRFARIHNKDIKGITPEVMEIIKSYEWHGNIRELMNSIESAVVMARKDHVDVDSLPAYLFAQPDTTTGIEKETLLDVERKAILSVLNSAGGNKAQAAKTLGIGLRTLYRKLEQYGLKE